MNYTCGIDIIEINRIKKSIEEMGEKFLTKIYSEKEIKYCEGKNNAKYQHYAARFAAKEAIFKAISCKLKDKFEITWTDAEILNDENGKPYIHFLSNKPQSLKQMDISISHCKEYAISNVIAIWEETNNVI